MSDHEIRILGVAATNIADPANKMAGLYRALGERFDLVGTVLVKLPRAREIELLARNIRPSKEAWLAQAGYAPGAFLGRTRAAERILARWDGRYDLIVQYQTIFGPGTMAAERPFVIYTDWTHALWCRHRRAALTSRRSDLRRNDDEAQTAALARHIFTMSELTRRSFIEDYGCDPRDVTAVGAGANSFDREDLSKHEGPPRALFVGYDFERKGGDVLLAAWPAVRRLVPGAELVIAGPPIRPDAGDGIRWIGRVGRSEVGALYRSATVFVLPSLLEPWGLVLHEAMGHGLPCIGVKAFAMPEIIDDGATGLLVTPGDVAALGAALAELLGDPPRAARMGEEARRRVLVDHLWARVVDRMAPAITAAVAP
jgi:glycosyltransferase involved in cell wall biosynthesis